MTLYNQICATVAQNIDKEAVESIKKDYDNWSIEGEPRSLEGRIKIENEVWEGAACISLHEWDNRPLLKKSLAHSITIQTLQNEINLRLVAITGVTISTDKTVFSKIRNSYQKNYS